MGLGNKTHLSNCCTSNFVTAAHRCVPVHTENECTQYSTAWKVLSTDVLCSAEESLNQYLCFEPPLVVFSIFDCLH